MDHDGGWDDKGGEGPGLLSLPPSVRCSTCVLEVGEQDLGGGGGGLAVMGHGDEPLELLHHRPQLRHLTRLTIDR